MHKKHAKTVYHNDATIKLTVQFKFTNSPCCSNTAKVKSHH